MCKVCILIFEKRISRLHHLNVHCVCLEVRRAAECVLEHKKKTFLNWEKFIKVLSSDPGQRILGRSSFVTKLKLHRDYALLFDVWKATRDFLIVCSDSIVGSCVGLLSRRSEVQPLLTAKHSFSFATPHSSVTFCSKVKDIKIRVGKTHNFLVIVPSAKRWDASQRDAQTHQRCVIPFPPSVGPVCTFCQHLYDFYTQNFFTSQKC